MSVFCAKTLAERAASATGLDPAEELAVVFMTQVA